MGVTNNNWQLLKAAVRFWGCYLACHGKNKQPGFLGGQGGALFCCQVFLPKVPTKDLRSKSKSCENVPNVEELIIIEMISNHLPGWIFVSGALLILTTMKSPTW